MGRIEGAEAIVQITCYVTEPDTHAPRLKLLFEIAHQLVANAPVPGAGEHADEIEFAVLSEDRGEIGGGRQGETPSLRDNGTHSDLTSAGKRSTEDRAVGVSAIHGYDWVVEVVVAGKRHGLRVNVVERAQEMFQHLSAVVIGLSLCDHMRNLRAGTDNGCRPGRWHPPEIDLASSDRHGVR